MTTRSFKKGDPRAVEAGKRGGAASGVTRRAQRIAKWAKDYPGCDPAILEQVRAEGYSAGHARALKYVVRRKPE